MFVISGRREGEHSFSYLNRLLNDENDLVAEPIQTMVTGDPPVKDNFLLKKYRGIADFYIDCKVLRTAANLQAQFEGGLSPADLDTLQLGNHYRVTIGWESPYLTFEFLKGNKATLIKAYNQNEIDAQAFSVLGKYIQKEPTSADGLISALVICSKLYPYPREYHKKLLEKGGELEHVLEEEGLDPLLVSGWNI